VVCLREISRPRQELRLDPLGLLSPTKTYDRGTLITTLTHHGAKTCFLDICKVISQVFAFCCVDVVNMLSVMQEVNNTRRHLVRISAFCCVDVVNMLSVMQEVNNMRRHLVRISAERKETPLPLKRRDQLYDQTRKWRSLSRHFRKDKLSCTCWKLNQDYSLDHHVSSSAYPESYFRI
jgi:hypothetical protein